MPESAVAGDWQPLFQAAFRQSRNPMALLDEGRRIVDVNGAYVSLLGYPVRELIGRPVYELVIGGPQFSQREWNEALAKQHLTGEAKLRHADGGEIGVQWAATIENVTGRRMVLMVALNTSRWGRAYRRSPEPERPSKVALTHRELDVVRLIALGLTGPEIAEELRLAHDTVRSHARNAMIKSGARSRAQLVAQALADGMALGPRGSG